MTEHRSDDPSASRAHRDFNHHLWRNGRIWWVAFTFHFGERKQRVRRTLATADVGEARARRDEMLARYAHQPGWRLALRFRRAAEVTQRGAA